MPSLALQLIAANKSSKATFLDLGNCDLSELPAEISDLVWLEGLSLAGQWHDMEKRQNNTSSNSGSKNQLANLKPLAGLSRLRVLHLGGTQVRDLRPLARLSSLR